MNTKTNNNFREPYIIKKELYYGLFQSNVYNTKDTVNDFVTLLMMRLIKSSGGSTHMIVIDNDNTDWVVKCLYNIYTEASNTFPSDDIVSKVKKLFNIDTFINVVPNADIGDTLIVIMQLNDKSKIGSVPLIDLFAERAISSEEEQVIKSIDDIFDNMLSAYGDSVMGKLTEPFDVSIMHYDSTILPYELYRILQNGFIINWTFDDIEIDVPMDLIKYFCHYSSILQNVESSALLNLGETTLDSANIIRFYRNTEVETDDTEEDMPEELDDDISNTDKETDENEDNPDAVADINEHDDDAIKEIEDVGTEEELDSEWYDASEIEVEVDDEW